MILQVLRDLIPWLAPPLIGAVIGYVTNDIAIRMLFRPLKPVKILGLRLPFTPGIFPKERHVLSRSIGRMVSRELITEDALRRQVRSEKTQAQLSAGVSDVTAGVFSTTIAGLSESVSRVITGSFEQLARDVIHRFLASRDMIHTVRDIITRAVSSLSGEKMHGVMDRLGVPAFISDRLLPALAEPETRRRLSESAGAALGKNAGGLLSDSLIASLSDFILPLLDPAVDHLVEWFRSDEMRSELEARGRKLVSDVLEKLNLLQRFFLTAGQFGRRLDEKMPEIVEEAIESLESLAREPENKRRILDVISGGLRDWRDSGGGFTRGGSGGEQGGLPAGRGLPEGTAGQGISRILDTLLSGLEKEDARRAIAGALEGFLLEGGDPTVGRALTRIFGLRPEEMAEKLSTLALEFLSRKDTAELISNEVIRFAGRFLEANAEKPLGEVLGIDAERKQRIDGFLTTRLMGLIDGKLPDILRGLDVETLVVEKIDSLDVKDVEKLILEVIATHLRWIDIFGAILGALIGMFQILLKLLHVS